MIRTWSRTSHTRGWQQRMTGSLQSVVLSRHDSLKSSLFCDPQSRFCEVVWTSGRGAVSQILSGTRTGSAAGAEGTVTFGNMDTAMLGNPPTLGGDVDGKGAGGAVDVCVGFAWGAGATGAFGSTTRSAMVRRSGSQLALVVQLTSLIALHEILCLLADTFDTLVSDALLDATSTWPGFDGQQRQLAGQASRDAVEDLPSSHVR